MFAFVWMSVHAATPDLAQARELATALEAGAESRELVIAMMHHGEGEAPPPLRLRLARALEAAGLPAAASEHYRELAKPGLPMGGIEPVVALLRLAPELGDHAAPGITFQGSRYNEFDRAVDDYPAEAFPPELRDEVNFRRGVWGPWKILRTPAGDVTFDAVALLQAVPRTSVRWCEAQGRIAIVKGRRGDDGAAIAALQDSVDAVCPEADLGRLSIGRIQMRHGRYADTLTTFGAIGASSARSSAARLEEARAHLQLGDTTAAAAALVRVTAPALAAEASLTRAILHIERGEYPEAAREADALEATWRPVREDLRARRDELLAMSPRVNPRSRREARDLVGDRSKIFSFGREVSGGESRQLAALLIGQVLGGGTVASRLERLAAIERDLVRVRSRKDALWRSLVEARNDQQIRVRVVIGTALLDEIRHLDALLLTAGQLRAAAVAAQAAPNVATARAIVRAPRVDLAPNARVHRLDAIQQLMALLPLEGGDRKAEMYFRLASLYLEESDAERARGADADAPRARAVELLQRVLKEHPTYPRLPEVTATLEAIGG